MSASWTDDRVETLTQLWKDGATASQIARDLGGVTRNAVIGKVHRLGLSGRKTPIAPGMRRAPKGERRMRRGAVAVAPPRRAIEVRAAGDTPAMAAPETGLSDIVSVGYSQCRWPIGDPLLDSFCLCGRPRERGAYCAAHGAVAYRPTPRNHLLKMVGLH